MILKKKVYISQKTLIFKRLPMTTVSVEQLLMNCKEENELNVVMHVVFMS